jgi:hypothetical protein
MEFSIDDCNLVATPAFPRQHLKALENNDSGKYIGIH